MFPDLLLVGFPVVALMLSLVETTGIAQTNPVSIDAYETATLTDRRITFVQG